MIYLICWLTIHSSNGPLDNRQFDWYRGRVMREVTEMYKVDFYEDFKKKNVDLEYNSAVKLVKDMDCHAE